jgi:SAM-dependent methyltransferase
MRREEIGGLHAMDGSDRLPSITRCAQGDLPVNVALMQAAMAASEPAEVDRTLWRAYERLRHQGAVREAARIGRAIELWNGAPEAFSLIKSIAGIADHRLSAADAEEHIAHWATVFDAAADISPEGSVALYSLGDARALDAMTVEVVDRMREWGLLSSDRAVLEIGCGIGRFIQALAPEVRSIVGIDISARMIEAARARCGAFATASLVQCSGHDLMRFPDAQFDLVYAIDTLPYLVDTGGDLGAACLHEAARVLAPGGHMLVLNWSYRGDLSADCADVGRIAGEVGLTSIRSGTRDLALWDGVTFLLERNVPRG